MRVYLAGEGHVLSLYRKRAMAKRLIDELDELKQLRLKLMADHPFSLLSYFYMKDNESAGNLLRALADDPLNIIMDSGLFSFMFGAEQGKMPNTYEAYRDYTRRYIEDVDRWGYEGLFVESDVHNLLGMDAVYRLREEFEEHTERVMYVWHRPEGLDGLVKLARERSYIALSIPEMRQWSSGTVGKKIKHMTGNTSPKVVAMVNDLLRRIHEACDGSPPRIHLLGCTVPELMQSRLAWSCDSTSWLAGVQWGKAHVFANSKIREVSIRSELFQHYRELAAKLFPDVVEFAKTQSNPEYVVNCLGCAHCFADYQRWLDRRWTNVPMRGAELPGGPYVDQG